MHVLPLKKRLVAYLRKRGLVEHYEKQRRLFEINPLHPGPHTELLKPKHLRIYSFRITRSYRAIFFYRGDGTVEITDINNHYR